MDIQLVMATFESQRKWGIGPIFILYPVPVTAPCKPQVPREARRLRRTPFRRFTTSKQRLQRLKVCRKIPVIISKRERTRRISFWFFATHRVGRSDMSWTARATKDRRTSGGKRACPRMAKHARRRRPQNQRYKSGTSRVRSRPVAGPLPRR